MQIYLVRHAQSRQNVDDPENYPYRPEVEEYEIRDASPTELGYAQADRTGKRLASVEFDAILCSPLHRHIATANGIIRYQKNKKLELINDLFEVWVIDYSGMPTELLQSLYPDCEIVPSPDPDPSGSKKTYSLKEMSTPAMLAERARRVEKYLASRFAPDAKVLLVSSGAFMSQYLIPAMLRLPERTIIAGVKYGCDHCSVTRIDLNKDGRRSSAVLINDTTHLDVDIDEISKIKNS